jgi:hypothetical protein
MGQSSADYAGRAALESLSAVDCLYTGAAALFFIVSLIGGLTWSLVGSGMGNYLLEKAPTTDRPAYLAWHNLALNAAVLLGSLGGSLLADIMPLTMALLLCFVARALAGVVMWKVG